jgi:hypothetical protein
VVSLSNHGEAGAAVLRQAQDEGGVRREEQQSSTTVVSLSNHGMAGGRVFGKPTGNPAGEVAMPQNTISEYPGEVVYIVRCADDSYYTGRSAISAEKRVSEHNLGVYAHTPRLGRAAEACQKPRTEKEGIDSSAAVLRQAQDEGGVCGEVISNQVVSLLNHGNAGAAVLT